MAICMVITAILRYINFAIAYFASVLIGRFYKCNRFQRFGKYMPAKKEREKQGQNKNKFIQGQGVALCSCLISRTLFSVIL